MVLVQFFVCICKFLFLKINFKDENFLTFLTNFQLFTKFSQLIFHFLHFFTNFHDLKLLKNHKMNEKIFLELEKIAQIFFFYLPEFPLNLITFQHLRLHLNLQNFIAQLKTKNFYSLFETLFLMWIIFWWTKIFKTQKFTQKWRKLFCLSQFYSLLYRCYI